MGFITKTLTSLSALLGVTSAIALPVAQSGISVPNNPLLNGAVTFSASDNSRPNDPCRSGNFVGRYFIGGGEGYGWCAVRFKGSGEVVKQVSVWSDKKGIRGIQFTFSSGHASMQGEQGQGSAQNFDIEAGELITSARLWGNGKGQHLGHIYLKTSKGKEFDVGMEKPNDGYEIEVGGGLLLGAAGRIDGDNIENMALIFLKAEIEKATVGGIKFDEDPTGTDKNMRPIYLIESIFGNPPDSDGDISFTISGAQTVTKETHWEQSTSNTFGSHFSVSVEAKPFGIGVGSEGGFEWSTDDTVSEGGSESEEVTITQTLGPNTLKPGEGKSCKILAQKGEGDFPYTSTVTLHLKGGGETKYEERGQLTSVQYSEAKGSCVDANQPIEWEATTDNPPKGVKVKKL
ncbi:MAG: hypothetical protein Q9164_002216 [Protoblastenia rupestris]